MPEQRDTDFHDVEGSIVLARAWLQSKAGTVKQFYSAYKSGKHVKGKEGSAPQNGSVRDIAKFLSKQGKTISYSKQCQQRKATLSFFTIIVPSFSSRLSFCFLVFD